MSPPPLHAQSALGTSLKKWQQPWFSATLSAQGVTLFLGGDWLAKFISQLECDWQAYLALDLAPHEHIQVIMLEATKTDTAGAALIGRMIRDLDHCGKLTAYKIPENSLVTDFLSFSFHPPTEEAPSLSFVSWLGKIVIKFGISFKSLISFGGETQVVLAKTLLQNQQLRWVSVAQHIEQVGVLAIPIVMLISFLIGMVLSYQSINQLSRFGAELYTVDFLGDSILREISVLLTAIVVAGRSGSSYAAQIGTMKLNQEIDALKMLNLPPILILVIPRVIALLVSLPLLVFLSMMVALLGGWLVTFAIIGLPLAQFLQQLQKAITISTFWVGIIKAPLFALLISLVGCYQGFQTQGNAESVGQVTTTSVVQSIFLVIVADSMLSILFSYLKV